VSQGPGDSGAPTTPASRVRGARVPLEEGRSWTLRPPSARLPLSDGRSQRVATAVLSSDGAAIGSSGWIRRRSDALPGPEHRSRAIRTGPTRSGTCRVDWTVLAGSQLRDPATCRGQSVAFCGPSRSRVGDNRSTAYRSWAPGPAPGPARRRPDRRPGRLPPPHALSSGKSCFAAARWGAQSRRLAPAKRR